MAVNNDNTNKLYPVNDTSVKFFCSLTRNQAKGTENFVYEGKECSITDFPGAVCFVSDTSGNSIFLNTYLFGDGAKSGSGSSGGGGLTEVNLSDISVTVDKDGNVLKSLADYFSTDGTFITDSLNITTEETDSLGNKVTKAVIVINKDGIKIGDDYVATTNYVSSAVSQAKTEAVSEATTQAVNKAKEYVDTQLVSVYKVKGTVNSYSSLPSSAKNGDVYNVKTETKNAEGKVIPAGTNYVYIDDGVNAPYWDALGGIIDLTIYAQTSWVSQLVSDTNETTLTSAKEYTDTKVSDLKLQVDSNLNSIDSINSSINNINTQVSNNTTSIENNTLNIENNTTNITNISTQLTWQ